MNTAAGAESAKLTCVSSGNSASPCLGAINQNPCLGLSANHKEDTYHPGRCLQQVLDTVALLWRKDAMVPPTHVALVAVLLLRFEAAAMGSPARNLKGIIFKNA